MAEGGFQYRSSRPPGLSDSDSDSTSDEDNEIWKRKRSRVFGVEEMEACTEFKNPLQSAPSHRSGFRKNNIWGDVVSEQTVAQDMLSFGVETGADIAHTVERDVESYKVNHEILEMQQELDEKNGDKMEDQMQDLPGSGDETAANIFDIENVQKSVKDRLGYSTSSHDQYRDVDDVGSDDGMSSSRRRPRDRQGREANQSEDFTSLLQQYQKEREAIKIGEKRKRERLKRFRSKEGKKGGNQTSILGKPVTADDSPEQVMRFVTNGLKEDNIKLFTLIVETVGNAKTLDLYSKTQDIEDVGGMMIMNGKRRRTPGGVFIQLLKSDKDVPKEMLDKIFTDSGEHWKQVKLAKRQKKRVAAGIKLAKEMKEMMTAPGMEGVYKEYLDKQMEGYMRRKEKQPVPCTDKTDSESNVPVETKLEDPHLVNSNDKPGVDSAEPVEMMMESAVEGVCAGEGSEEGEILDSD